MGCGPGSVTANSRYREGSFARVGIYEADIAALIQAYRPGLDRVLEELSDYLWESDLQEVRDIISEAQERIERYQKRNDLD
ncbi:MAG TPA: hypothetical protein VMN57_12370 [Anaerolineales bacterium]|nr:hypothetical protein [Anaerolineales bacterium]